MLQTSPQLKDVPTSSSPPVWGDTFRSLQQFFERGGSIQSIKGQTTTPWAEPELQLHFLQRLKRAVRSSDSSAQLTVALRTPSSTADSRPQKAAAQHWEQKNELCVTLEGGTQPLQDMPNTKPSAFLFTYFASKRVHVLLTPNTHILPQCCQEIKHNRLPTVLAKHWSLIFQIKKQWHDFVSRYYYQSHGNKAAAVLQARAPVYNPLFLSGCAYTHAG